MSLPHGIINHNPGNLRANPSIPWVGQTGSDASGFCVFGSPIYGLRALALDLFNSWSAGRVTVQELVSHYAPPSENNTAQYIQNVETFTGSQPGAVLDFHNASFVTLYIRAVIIQEQGKNDGQEWYPEATIQEGMREAGKWTL